MTKRNMASFVVTPRLIEDALHMPEEHNIIGVEWDFTSRTVRLFVEGPDLPIVEPGEMMPNITPKVSVHDDPATNIREYKWNWGLSS